MSQAPPTPGPMVELLGVTKRWGATVAVDDVTLAVRPGELLTLLGPSGCGKTTMLRMIGGFETPTLGRVRVDGQDVTTLPPYRRPVNQVFQSYALFPHLTVRQNIEFGPRTQRLGKTEIAARVDEAVRTVALGDLQGRRPHQLSGGQRQRVALARAIVNRPKVLLLDEPLSALDAKLRAEVRVELKHLQHRLGTTFVFVTHDQDEALTMSDRVAVVYRGRIEQLDTAEAIYRRPRTRFVATFVGQTNLIDGRVTATDGGTARVAADGLDLVATLDGVAAGEAVTLSVRPEDVIVSATSPGGPNAVEGVVEDVLFRGAVSDLRVRAGGRVWQAQGTPPTGQTVWLSIRPDAFVRLTDA